MSKLKHSNGPASPAPFELVGVNKKDLRDSWPEVTLLTISAPNNRQLHKRSRPDFYAGCTMILGALQL